MEVLPGGASVLCLLGLELPVSPIYQMLPLCQQYQSEHLNPIVYYSLVENAFF